MHPAKSAAVVYPELPGIEAGSNAMVARASAAGVAVKRVSWSPNATDLVGPLTAAGAQTADVLDADADPKSCVNLAKTIASLKLKAPVVSQPLCLNAEVAKGLGDLPKWTYGIASSLATDTKDPADGRVHEGRQPVRRQGRRPVTSGSRSRSRRS